MTLNKNDIAEDKRSCSVWDTGSSNVVTFKHFELRSNTFWAPACPYGESLSAQGRSQSEKPEKNSGNVRQERRKERQSWSTAPKLKSHVPTVWLPTATRHDVTGSWSWTRGSLPRITGGRWEEYSLQGKSYLARVAVGLEPGASGGGRIDGCLRDLQESTRTKVTRCPS